MPNADDLGEDRRPRELMGERLERDGHADHRPDPRTPDARRADHDVGRDLAAIRDDRPDPAVVRPDAGDGVVAEEPSRHPPSRGAPGPRRRGRNRSGRRLGTWYAPTMTSRSTSGHSAAVSSGSMTRPSRPHDSAKPRRRWSSAEAVRRQSELQAADRVETPPSVERQGPRLLDRVPGEFGHRLRRIRLEDDARARARWTRRS